MILRYVHDMSENDIADALGTARGTVAATLHGAVRRLRSELAEEILPPEEVQLP